MQYVDMVRNYQKDMELSKAVQKAVDQCIKNNILRTFLLANKSEVVSMTIFEYDEELHKKTLLEEGYEDGLGDGEMLAIISLVCKKLQKGKTIEEIVTELEEEELVKKVIDVIQGLEIPYNPKDVLQKLKKLDE